MRLRKAGRPALILWGVDVEPRCGRWSVEPSRRSRRSSSPGARPDDEANVVVHDESGRLRVLIVRTAILPVETDTDPQTARTS